MNIEEYNMCDLFRVKLLVMLLVVSLEKEGIRKDSSTEFRGLAYPLTPKFYE